ncbi:MAG: GNAT family N-acetyltransferase [Caulobacteraceae bacterium]|nr:GNAT family N-acetyltransferase [Caulobacteraceae bacterium]
MRIEVVRPEELNGDDQRAWSAILQARPELASPFLTPAWSRAVERAGCPDEVRVAMVEDREGLKAVFPARCGVLTALPPGAPLRDRDGVIAVAGPIELEPAALLGALGVHRYDFSHLCTLDPVFGPHAQGVQDSYAVDVSNGWDAYEQNRREAGTDILKDMAKKRRKIERELGSVTFTPLSRSRADFEKLITWKRAAYFRGRQTDVLATDWVMRLLNELFESRDPEFGGALMTLHIGDRLAAAQFNVRGHRELHSWFIAHDEQFDRYSPGLVLFHAILRWMAETSPLKRLELGPVAYRFKDRLANAPHPIAHGYAGLDSPVTLLRAAEYGLRKAAERLPLGRASHWPGKAMRRLDLWRGLG